MCVSVSSEVVALLEYCRTMCYRGGLDDCRGLYGLDMCTLSAFVLLLVESASECIISCLSSRVLSCLDALEVIFAAP